MAGSDGEKQLAKPLISIRFTMSDALIKSCKQVEAILKSTPLKTQRASRGVLRLAQENLDRLEQEIAAFKEKHGGPGMFYPQPFCSAVIRPVEGFVFECFFDCARVSLEQGSYEEALKFAKSAGQFSVSRDDAWEVRVATEVLDVVRASYQGLGNMEAFAAATMDQARMCGALGLDNECRVKILCEAAAAQSGLEHCTDAIASASEALRVAETPQGEMYAQCTLGGAFLDGGSDAGVGLLHFEEAEKLAKVHGRGDFFVDAADFAEFREAVAFGLRRCRKIVAHEDEVAEDAFDLAAIGCERAPLPAQA
jgi:hypothetical protein